MRKLRRDAGQAMAEFAISAMIFFALILMVMDGGRILWHYVSLSEAARVSARYAIVHGARSTDELTVDNYREVLGPLIRQRSPGLDAGHLVIERPVWEDGSKRPGTMVTITLNYAVQPLTSIVFRGMTFTLRSHSAMAIQN